MVNTGTTTTTTALNSDKPSVIIAVNTYLKLGSGEAGAETFKLCQFSLSIKNVKVSLASSAFSRAFSYLQTLANNDVNPLVATQPAYSNISSAVEARTPEGGLQVDVDYSQVPPTVSMIITSKNLRLDYMDEFLGSTLDYLDLSLSNDLNPG